MTAPLSADVRGGIRNWGGALGNEMDADCVVAGFEQLRKTKAVTSASTWRKVLYRIGFRPPHEAYTLEIYAEYLATLGEKPGPDAGIYPLEFFTWAKGKGLIKDFGSVDQTQPDLVKQAMIDHHGVLLTTSLTVAAMSSEAVPNGLWAVDGTRANQPAPQFQHAIALVEYDMFYWRCVTWGFIVRLAPSFYRGCVNGCWWFEE